MQKGSLDVTLDSSAITDIIIFANEFRIAITDRAEAIRGICAKMTEDETLNGGDGENIKEIFKTIGAGYMNVEQSAKYIVGVLNERLNNILKMTKGNTTAEAEDATKNASKNMGVLKRS